jgi:hypothetical protein
VNDDALEVDQNTTDIILEFFGLDESKVQERGAMLQTQQAAERQLEQERQRNRRERRAQEAAASQNAWGPKGSSPAPVGARAPPPPPPPPPPPSKGSRHTATQETSWERPAALLAPPVSPKQQRQHARLHWDTLHRRHGAAKLAADAFKVGHNRVTHARTHARTLARTHVRTHSVLP